MSTTRYEIEVSVRVLRTVTTEHAVTTEVVETALFNTGDGVTLYNPPTPVPVATAKQIALEGAIDLADAVRSALASSPALPRKARR